MTPGVEIAVRIGGAALIFTAMALREWHAPRRPFVIARRPRWFGNPGILGIDIVAVRLLVPTAAVGIALIAARARLGPFAAAPGSAIERLLRLVIVTPQMHEVHHSAERAETDSNFGFNLTCRDRLFGTYREKPGAGDNVVIGLPVFRGETGRKITQLLTQLVRNAV